MNSPVGMGVVIPRKMPSCAGNGWKDSGRVGIASSLLIKVGRFAVHGVLDGGESDSSWTIIEGIASTPFEQLMVPLVSDRVSVPIVDKDGVNPESRLLSADR